ncbi:MAG: PQQ-binding-like beta-propeller repeat protein [Chrysiogenales bacterium]
MTDKKKGNVLFVFLVIFLTAVFQCVSFALPIEVNQDSTVNKNRAVLKMATITWQFKAESGIHSSPVLAENLLFFGSDDGTLFALDLSPHFSQA